MSREIRVRVAIKSPHWDDNVASVNGWLVSTNSFTIGEFWDRLVELEFKDGGSLPFGDIDWSEDEVKYLQYTGIHDKSGKEVYEGDLVKYRRHPEKTKIGQVMWSDNCPELKINEIGWNVYVSFNALNSIEVIGNIYENPELLTPAA